LFKRTPVTIADPVIRNRRPTERIFVGLIFLSIMMTFIKTKPFIILPVIHQRCNEFARAPQFSPYRFLHRCWSGGKPFATLV